MQIFFSDTPRITRHLDLTLYQLMQPIPEEKDFLTLQLLLTTTSIFHFLSFPPVSSIAGVSNTTPLSILKHVKLMKDWQYIIV